HSAQPPHTTRRPPPHTSSPGVYPPGTAAACPPPPPQPPPGRCPGPRPPACPPPRRHYQRPDIHQQRPGQFLHGHGHPDRRRLALQPDQRLLPAAPARPRRRPCRSPHAARTPQRAPSAGEVDLPGELGAAEDDRAVGELGAA